uniref:Uncharacterized protein n=1 Tax=Myotis myotis TaxID=51298 RepID=A0A7J7RDV9_MYOMY|nr:hypothetical protein mMyoMyo1_010378 [Myotis myotis]
MWVPACTHPETALEQSPTHWTLGHRCLPGGATGSLGLRMPGAAGGCTVGLREAACKAAVTSIVCEEISFVIFGKYFITACSVHVCEWESDQHVSCSRPSGEQEYDRDPVTVAPRYGRTRVQPEQMPNKQYEKCTF